MVTMNIVITGGSGFVGSYLCEKLINDGHKIIVIDNLLTGSTENINNWEFTSEPITVPGGFLILKVNEIKEEEVQVNFDESGTKW